jgi:hydrogenase nickel incorporation protein HypA/HybF
MHEQALMADLMRQVLKTAGDAGARRVTAISVWLGALSHMTPGHFAEHFADAARGTIADGATVTAHTSDDIHDPRATGVVVKHVEVET